MTSSFITALSSSVVKSREKTTSPPRTDPKSRERYLHTVHGSSLPKRKTRRAIPTAAAKDSFLSCCGERSTEKRICQIRPFTRLGVTFPGSGPRVQKVERELRSAASGKEIPTPSGLGDSLWLDRKIVLESP
jgi:hypothetical protein